MVFVGRFFKGGVLSWGIGSSCLMSCWKELKAGDGFERRLKPVGSVHTAWAKRSLGRA